MVMHHQQNNNNSQCFFCTVHIPLLLLCVLMVVLVMAAQQLLFVEMIRYRLASDFPHPAVAADTVAAAAYTTELFFSFPPRKVG